MAPTALSTLCGVGLLIVSNAASALPSGSDERARLFATCSGRLSAIAAHERAHSHPTAGQYESLRTEFDMLLDATMPFAREEGVTDGHPVRWQAAGWVQIAYLLPRRTIPKSAETEHPSWAMIVEQVEICRRILLPATD